MFFFQMSCQKAVAPDKITATRLPENSILQPWRNSNESTGGPGQVSIEISKAQKFHLLLWWFLYNNPIPEYFPRPYLFPWGFGTLQNWPMECLSLESFGLPTDTAKALIKEPKEYPESAQLRYPTLGIDWM